MLSSNAIRSWLRMTAGTIALLAACAPALAGAEPAHSAALDAMIVKEAQRHGVPERLVRRIVMRESRYNPQARNHKYWGLMQISYPTARSMGFRGTPEQLLNPLVNLTYAVPYLANAFIVAGKREDAAVRLYASGYYDTARQRGLLGVMRTAASSPATGFQDDVQPVAAAQESVGIFGSLLNPFDPASQPVQVAADGSGQVAPAAGSPAEPASASARGTLARGKGGAGNVDMVASNTGATEPPKKWMHDGGVTVLARGEQGNEHVAGLAGRENASARHAASRHSRKSTLFAAVDAPASAQAYAANADGAAPSQSAIAEAIAPGTQTSTGNPAQPAAAYASAPAGMQEASASAAPVSASPADASASDQPARRKRKKVAKRHRAAVAVANAKPAEIEAEPADAVAALRP